MKVFSNSISLIVLWRRFPVPASDPSDTRTRRWIPLTFLEEVFTKFADWIQRICLSQRSEETTSSRRFLVELGLASFNKIGIRSSQNPAIGNYL